jgi:hypothetical protein
MKTTSVISWSYFLVVAATYALLLSGLRSAILHSPYGITLEVVLSPFCLVGIAILLKRPFLLRDSFIFFVASAVIALCMHLAFPRDGIMHLLELALFVQSLLLCVATIYRGIFEYFVNRRRAIVWAGDGLMLFVCKKCFFYGWTPFPGSAFRKGLHMICERERCRYLNKFGRHRFQHIPNPYK